MTLPCERIRAVQAAREFLRDLLDPKKTPRVPKEVRLRAYRVLKHYPGDFYLPPLTANDMIAFWGLPPKRTRHAKTS